MPFPTPVRSLSICLALGAATAAPAQPADPARDLINGDANRRAVSALVVETGRGLAPPDCRDIKGAGDATVTVLQPVAFGGDGKPRAGSWKDSFPVNLCGKALRINALSSVAPDGTIRRQPLLPGTTMADPLLQRDALTTIFAAAATKARRDCKDFKVVDTTFGAMRPAAIPGRPPWRESWTVAACGDAIPIGVDFNPDATGTSIAVDLGRR